MKTTSQPRPAADAFTLVELLTVIAIIAILMGLLFPAIGIVKEQARKVQAKTDVTNIVTAVKQYYTEYGKYPPVVDPAAGPAPAGDAKVGDKAATMEIDNNALFDTLRSIDRGLNKDYVLNPRRIVFFEGKSSTDSASPRAGFNDAATDLAKLGIFYDPWGKEYNVVIDSDYDNIIAVDSMYTDFDTTHPVRVGVGAFSTGKDNTLGKNNNKLYKEGTTLSDDVISWQ
jgi:prepilin-type N-terminal cleavage/methylation domain-containing protein